MATYDLTTTTPSKLQSGDIINCPYSGTYKSIELPKGEYKLEVWGAQGGNGADSNSGFDSSSGAIGGKGGYSIGILSLTETCKIFLYTGGKGGCITSSKNDYTGGFNGGGTGGVSGAMSRSGGGGGASDIRIGQDSLYARVIVAGGGGATSWGPTTEYAGSGGGTSSTNGSNTPALATQTSGNAFGIGGNAYIPSNSSYNINGAGGGGWYGGIVSTSNMSSGSKYHGGGGSGYVYTSSTASNYPSGCLLNSAYYLTDAQTIAGNVSFTSPSGSSETGHSGDGYIRISVIEVSPTISFNNTIYDLTTTTPSKLQSGDIINCPYSGTMKSITLPKGKYKLEVWGAQGGMGNPSSNIGGKGGYSIGMLTLLYETCLYIYSGQSGSHAKEVSTFGGGGKAEASSSYNSGQGGGASDIRIGSDSLYARVIVAGGGGGGAGANESTYIGGYGGGTSGGNSEANSSGAKDIVYGAAQTSAGYSSAGSYSDSQLSGAFGSGGYYGGAGSRSGGGGGGGWYGGGAGSYGTAGSGGSGYVYTSSTASDYPSGCLLNSSYYLTDAQTIAGNVSFTSPSGSSETGHSGDGYVRISVIELIGETKEIIINYGNTKLYQGEFEPPIAVIYNENEIFNIEMDNNNSINCKCENRFMKSDLQIGDILLKCKNTFMTKDIVINSVK